MMFRRERCRRAWRGAAVTAAGGATLVAAVTLSGCSKPLFPRDQPRSPYERYAELRGDAVPKSRPNTFGIDQPDLRDRLKPMDAQ